MRLQQFLGRGIDPHLQFWYFLHLLRDNGELIVGDGGRGRDVFDLAFAAVEMLLECFLRLEERAVVELNVGEEYLY
jgi:hypothetical protein